MVSLVQRDGMTRSFRVANIDGDNLKPILMANIARDSHLMTDRVWFSNRKALAWMT